jgi:hypothetical protein
MSAWSIHDGEDTANATDAIQVVCLAEIVSYSNFIDLIASVGDIGY